MNTTLRAMINQAERLVRSEVYEEAIALCQAVLRRYPRYARCYRIMGEAYLGLAEHEEAAKLFRRALGVDPEDPVAFAGLAIVFEERGLLDEAIWQLERAFELAPGRDELRHELARLYQQRGERAPVQLTRAALARLYARGSLWDKAVGELRDLVAREPYRLDLWATLARTLWRARRRAEAAEAAQAILDEAPNCLVARLILGTYWCQEGREDEGRKLLQGAQELDPENREAARLLARDSLLPLRVAHVDSDVDFPGGLHDEPEEEAPQWPRPLAMTPEATRASDDEQTRGDEEHIVVLPAESVHALLASAAEEDDPVDDELPEEEGGGVAVAAETPVEVTGAQPGIARGQGLDAILPETTDRGEPAGAALPDAADQGDMTSAALPGAAVAGPGDGGDVPVLLSPVTALRRRLEASPEDREARLALARALAERGDLAEALPLYDKLATPASGLLDEVLADLEEIARVDPQHRSLRELLGDAYARAGRFQEAMAMYRWLLASGDTQKPAGGRA